MSEKNHLYDFPDPGTANKDGMVAYGGNLSPATLINAYSKGIFPWYDKSLPILWWSPDPRMTLFPDEYKVSKSLKHQLRSDKYECRADTSFRSVVKHCAAVKRKDQEGTWITDEMAKAYLELHKQGLAHSVETYYEGSLVGGLYGVSLGGSFFGESMFHLERDASKVAFHHLVELLKSWKFDMIDAQVPTDHLRSLGARPVPRVEFLELLAKSLQKSTRRGKWELLS